MTAAPADDGIGTGMSNPLFDSTAPETGKYADWSLDAILADFVLVRGDLTEEYAREQIVRAILDSADVADLVAEAFAEGRTVQARETASFCRDEAAKPDPATGDHTTPSYWNGHNAALRQVAERQETRIAEQFAFPTTSGRAAA